MKKKIFLCLLIVSFIGCNQKDVLDYTWEINDRVVIEDSKYNSYTHFNPETKKMEGDTMIPIKKLDSTYIITRVTAKREFDKEDNLIITGSEVISDTVYFEIRNFGGPKLLIHYKRYLKPIILDPRGDIKISETIKVYPPSFKIAELTIGDTINRERIAVREIEDYFNLSIEKAILLEDPDVELEIVADSIIYSITRHDIDPSKIETIINVVDSKMGKEANYYPPLKDYESYKLEIYKWSKDGVEIKLTHIEDNIFNENEWKLEYIDNIKQALLLDKFRDTTPVIQ